MNLPGVDTQGHKKVELRIRTVLYDNDIQDVFILSDSWCQLLSVEIHPRGNGILCVSKEQTVWVGGGV